MVHANEHQVQVEEGVGQPVEEAGEEIQSRKKNPRRLMKIVT